VFLLKFVTAKLLLQLLLDLSVSKPWTRMYAAVRRGRLKDVTEQSLPFAQADYRSM